MFNIEQFLTDINESTINSDVTSCQSLDEAAERFQSTFSGILNHHAPMKIFQMRKNYLPYLSPTTKNLIEEKGDLMKTALKEKDKDALKKAKIVGKEIKKSIKKDKDNYFNQHF